MPEVWVGRTTPNGEKKRGLAQFSDTFCIHITFEKYRRSWEAIYSRTIVLRWLIRPDFIIVNVSLKRNEVILKVNNAFYWIECFHMTSRRPYWCPKTMKRRPCWCPKPVLWELNSFLMQTLSFVPINLHRWWSREWKHSIKKHFKVSFRV